MTASGVGQPPLGHLDQVRAVARQVEGERSLQADADVPALAAYLKPREEGRADDQYAEVTDVVKTLGQVADYWLRDPQRALELQSSLGKAYLDLWANAVKRMAGEKVEPVAAPAGRRVPPLATSAKSSRRSLIRSAIAWQISARSHADRAAHAGWARRA